MDRLSAVIVAAALAACDSKAGGQQPSGRANTGKVAAAQVNVDAFCDKHYAGDTGPALQLPAVVDGTLPSSSPNWRWINAWATWCSPCVKELPRLAWFRDTLAGRGHEVDLALISVDEDPADVAAFRAENPTAPPSVRIAQPGGQAAWFTSIGLDAGAPVPVHVFVRPSGHVACVRAGSVQEHDLRVVEKLLAE